MTISTLRGKLYLASLVVIAHVLLAGSLRAQTAPSWLIQGQGGRLNSVTITEFGDALVVGVGDFWKEGVRLGDSTTVGDRSTSAFIGRVDAEGDFRWGSPAAFRLANEDFFLGVDVKGFEISLDAGGSFYTSEGFSYWMDSDMLTAGGVSINKYAADGTHAWSIPVHPPVEGTTDQPGYILGLDTDQAGNVYAAGMYRDTLIIGGDTLAAFPLEHPDFVGDVFLASFRPNGTIRWSRRIGGSRHDVMAEWRDPRGAFAVDAEGNTYVGSFYSRGAVFGEGQSGEVTSASDAYAVVSYDAEGTFRWVRTGRDLGITENAGPWRLAADPSGNLIVDWFVRSTGGINEVTIGDTTFIDPGFGGDFISKIDPDGTILWARQIESDGNERITNVTTDAQGHVYVAGNFDGTYLRLEDTELLKQDLQADREDSFVAHYDADGRLLWAEHAGGEGIQRITSVAASASGDVYITGIFFDGTMRLGGEAYTPKTYEDMFLAKFDAATITGTKEVTSFSANDASLRAYPNPAQVSAIIEYQMGSPGNVHLAVFDVLGRQVALLTNQFQAAGHHEAILDGSRLANGLYFVRLEVDNGQYTASLLITR